MQDQRERRILLRGRVIPAFDASRGTGKDDLRHGKTSADTAGAERLAARL
jgi:hypothetical protein